MKENQHQDLPGGPVVKNPPSNTGGRDLIPGLGTKIPHAKGQLSPCAPVRIPHATTINSTGFLEEGGVSSQGKFIQVVHKERVHVERWC